MSGKIKTFFREVLGLVLLLTCFLPLNAQLDPRLQASKTDFTNLYQQSTSLKARPEIMTVFDYSGSMASLMYHPLYRNDDVSDRDAYRTMRFDLTVGATSPVVAPNNRYLIRARAYCNGSLQSGGAMATYQVTVGASSATGSGNTPTAACPVTPLVPHPTAPSYTIKVAAAGNTNANATITLSPTASGTNPSYSLTGNGNTGTKSNTLGSFTITHQNKSTTPAPTIEMSPASGPYGSGTTITLTAYLTHPLPPVQEPPLVDNTGMTWSISNTGNLGPNAAGTLGTTTTTTVSTGLYKSVTTFKIPPYTPWDTPAGGDPMQLRPITVSPSSPFSPGSTITLNTYFLTRGTGTNFDRIVWDVQQVDTTNQTCATSWSTITNANTTGNTTSFQASKSVTWTIPPYQNPTTCSTGGVPSGSYVTVTLDPRAGANPVPGVTYLGSVLTAATNAASGLEALRKPDGTPVTQADADAASSTSGLRGAAVSPRSNDVRNWIRAASHVRFKSGTRTIDIPIPWKITNRDSMTANPLKSVTLTDKQMKPGFASDGSPITIPYGSGSEIELDRNYAIEGSSGAVFTDNNAGALPTTATTTAYLNTVAYRPGYVSWLFTGKYQNTSSSAANYTTDATLVGKYIVFDAGATLAAGQGNSSWGQGYGPAGNWGNMIVPRYKGDGSYLGTISTEASKYATPGVTRMQATKRAAIQTWINHQADVFWAFRCLDPNGEANGGDATDISNDSQTTISATDATTTKVNGQDTGWTVLNNTEAQGKEALNGNSVKGMKRIASMFANDGTPLTYAAARGLAQYGDPNNVFNSVVGDDVSQCVNHYFLLFTDGLDNNGTGTLNGNNNTPYIQGTGVTAYLDVLKGNQSILANKDQINRYGASWNLFTFAGIAAHLSDPSYGTAGTDFMAAPDPGTTSKTGTPSTFLPFAIKKRNGVPYENDHRITTMTVGVSLGGQYTDPTSPKRTLFLGAVVGDPITKTGLLSDFHTFNGWDQVITPANPLDPNNDWIPDPQDPNSYPASGKRKAGAVFFFDATDPDKLVTSLEYAFRIAIGSKANNATSNPNLPFTGASFGKQVYMGNFQPPTIANAIWSGDLFMFGTKEVSGKTILVDKAGNQAGVLDASTAQWTASDALLTSRNWNARKLYTRIPNATILQEFKDSGTTYTDNTTGLKNFVAKAMVPGSDSQRKVIQFMMGADSFKGPYDVNGWPLPSSKRTNIMGDIINSAPASLEYKWDDVKGSLTPRLASLTGGNRFRIIMVGTNQGWMHAFGEVSKVTKLLTGPNAGQEIVEAVVDELWSFMPTDLLANLDYLYQSSNAHRFTVDGTPAIYHLDLPAASGVTNGVVDATGDERAIAVFGLRKGGRSYYALDIKDPFTPKLRWSLVPDEAAGLDGTRIITGTGAPALSTVQTIVKNMGFSSCTPAFGRIQFNDILRDAVFLGGGASSPEIDHNFPVYPAPNLTQTTPLGRSVIALDVYTGKVLAAQDMTASTVGGSSVGPVSAGVIPFEFILNSGMAQRAYFLDYKGGLWAWGSKDVSSSSPYTNFRQDTSELSKWSMRKVYKDSNLAGSLGAKYTTLPAPFRVGSFTGKGKSGAVTPPAVGVAMVSGDRNNPLDEKYDSTDKAPVKHRLTVVFDRQDSRSWTLDTAGGPDLGITDNDLINFSGNKVTATPASLCGDDVFKLISPSCPSTYYLTAGDPPKFGYYVDFPAMSNNFLSKGINPPIIVAGSLYYTYFTPTKADPCKGGAGVSDTFKIADVLNPVVDDTRTGPVMKLGGKLDRWAGVASDFIPLGTKGVLQGGVVSVANPQAGASLTTPEIHSYQGNPNEKYPKPRVWRTVH